MPITLNSALQIEAVHSYQRWVSTYVYNPNTDPTDIISRFIYVTDIIKLAKGYESILH